MRRNWLALSSSKVHNRPGDSQLLSLTGQYRFRSRGRIYIAPSNLVVAGKADTMSNIFQLLTHEEQLTDELFAFITDPSADNRNERAIVSVLHEVLPHMVSVAECMILDGVDQRHYVADYVHAVLSGEGLE